MVSFLEPLQKKGVLRRDIDLTTAVTVFFGALTSHILLYNVVKGIECDVPEEQFVDTLCGLFIRGIQMEEEPASEELPAAAEG
jgi:hypothetical protein